MTKEALKRKAELFLKLHGAKNFKELFGTRSCKEMCKHTDSCLTLGRDVSKYYPYLDWCIRWLDNDTEK